MQRSAFTETGVGGLSLNVADTTLDTPRSLTGVDFHTGGGSIEANLQLAWAHDFGEVAAQTDATLVGSPLVPFKAVSSLTGRDAGVVQFALSTHVEDAVSAFVEYDGEFRTRSTSQAASLGLRVDW